MGKERFLGKVTNGENKGLWRVKVDWVEDLLNGECFVARKGQRIDIWGIYKGKWGV